MLLLKPERETEGRRKMGRRAGRMSERMRERGVGGNTTAVLELYLCTITDVKTNYVYIGFI